MHTLIAYIRIIGFFLSTLPDLSRAKKLKKNGDGAYTQPLNRQFERAMEKIPKILGVTFSVTGEENIIRDRAVIYVSNHQSYPDPVFIFKPMGFIFPVLCKKEVRKIPLLSSWLKVFDCVFIDREDARSSVASLREASELVNSGKSILIFPEGTRSYSGEVGEFKSGAFKIAEKTRVPVVPVRLHNACDVMRRGSGKLCKANIRIDYLEPIDISDMTRTELRELPSKIQALIADGIKGVQKDEQ